MDPRLLVQQTLFLESKIPSVLANTFLSILVSFDNIIDTSPCHAWHDDQSTTIKLQFTLEQTRLPEEI